jgi:demethylmenaquinone methyltransferase/2-methoxy-6-polyprenyl-1,4-benzoquinol methylase
MPDPVAVNSMFARIARRYDVANHLLSAGVDIRWRRQLVKAVRRAEPHAILDLATGSGDVAFALSRNLPEQVQILGMDFCQPMLDEAEIKKHSRHYANVTFQQGDGLALPLADNSYDAVTISFGLRNMGDLRKSLSEMRRVLRPSGRMFILEFSRPSRWFRSLYYFYLRRILPGFAQLVTGDRAAYVYLNETIEQFPDRDTLSAEIRAAGFGDVKARGLTFGVVALHEAVK